MALTDQHPVVQWLRQEVVPLLVERLAPAHVIAFDPPDRPADLAGHAPGMLIVARAFRGVAVPERNAAVQALLASASPVRPLCLTPEEFAQIGRVPGSVLAAARAGVSLL